MAYAEEDGRVRFEAAQLRSTLNANKEQANQQYSTDKANMSIAHKKAIQEKDAADMKKVSDILEEVTYRDWETDRKSTRLNSSHITRSRMPSSA